MKTRSVVFHNICHFRIKKIYVQCSQGAEESNSTEILVKFTVFMRCCLIAILSACHAIVLHVLHLIGESRIQLLVLSISTDVRRRESATSVRDVGYFFPKLK